MSSTTADAGSSVPEATSASGIADATPGTTVTPPQPAASKAPPAPSAASSKDPDVGSDFANVVTPGTFDSNSHHELQHPVVLTVVASDAPTALLKDAIGTHSGSFHCDEALACGLLKLLPEYRHSPIIRTRNPKVLDQCKIVVDVGGTHDHSAKRYDHHQRSFNADNEDVTIGMGFSTKLSSAGLVYKYYGRAIVDQLRQAAGAPEDAAILEKILEKVYAGFVEHIDGIDNGIEAFEGGSRCYKISTDLSSRVGKLNPSWNSNVSTIGVNRRFREAVLLTQKEFIQHVLGLYESWLPARTIVKESMLSRPTWGETKASIASATSNAAAAEGAATTDGGDNDVDDTAAVVAAAAAAGGSDTDDIVMATGLLTEEILVLKQYCPWKEHLFDLEEEMNIAGVTKYVVYPSSDGSTRVQAVPVAPSSFTSRKSLPAIWCGVRDEELSALTNIEGCIFVHNNGFIGGAKTHAGALAMAVAALEL